MVKEVLPCLTPSALFVLVLQAGLFCLGAEVISEISVSQGKEVTLSCKDHMTDGVQYWGISWYKVVDDGLSGIIFNNFKEKTVQKYRGCSLAVRWTPTEPYSLVISNISSEDLGMYHCFLWAPIGEENKKGFVSLKEMGHTSSLTLNWMLTIPLIAVFCLLSLPCLHFMIKKITRQRENYGKLINTDLRNSIQIQIEEPIKDELNST